MFDWKRCSMLLLTTFATSCISTEADDGTLEEDIQRNNNCAIKSNEKGHLDTQVEHADFWDRSFTLSAWFMPEFTHADVGPVFGSVSGGFWVGMGNYRSGAGDKGCEGEPMLSVKIAGTLFNYEAPSLGRDHWSHLAMVVRPTGWPDKTAVELYLDGVRLPRVERALDPSPSDPDCEHFTIPDPSIHWVSTADLDPPTGDLLLGRSGKRFFYGLIDDVAIYDRSLSAAEVATLADDGAVDATGLIKQLRFNGNPYQSCTGASPPVHAPAELVGVGDGHVGSSSSIFDAPAHISPTTATYHLPFAPGEIWKVIQGNDSPGGSHNGFASYSYDFAIANGSVHHQVRAAAKGTIVDVIQDGSADTDHEGNYVHTQTAVGEATSHLHLEQCSFAQTYFNWPGGLSCVGMQVPHDGDDTLPLDAEQPMGKVGNQAKHLHFALHRNETDGWTIPMAFTDYEVAVSCSDGDPILKVLPQPWASGGGCWQPVPHGRPAGQTFIRRPL